MPNLLAPLLAGLGPPNPAELVTEADFDLTLNVNLKGTFSGEFPWSRG